MERILMVPTAAVLVGALAGCSTGDGSASAQRAASTVPPLATPSRTLTSQSPRETPSEPALESDGEIVGTVVRFTFDRTTVDVTIGEDSPAVRDFLSMLPLELSVEEFDGREKISYLPRVLEIEGSPGSDPEDGDLAYYTPWGNLAFYYDASGVGYSDSTLHFGTYSPEEDQLALMEGDVLVHLPE